MYSKFIMRDLLSFVTPGAIIVGTLFLIHWDLSWKFEFFKSIPFMLYIPCYGFLYIVGFAVLSLGHVLGIIQFGPKTDEEYYTRLANIFKKIDNEKAMILRERIIIIKQMCGIGALSISIASVLLVIKLWMPILSPWALGFLIVILIFSLFNEHRRYVQRHETWEYVVWHSMGDTKYTSLLSMPLTECNSVRGL